jgi:hypothetical protein
MKKCPAEATPLQLKNQWESQPLEDIRLLFRKNAK